MEIDITPSWQGQVKMCVELLLHAGDKPEVVGRTRAELLAMADALDAHQANGSTAYDLTEPGFSEIEKLRGALVLIETELSVAIDALSLILIGKLKTNDIEKFRANVWKAREITRDSLK